MIQGKIEAYSDISSKIFNNEDILQAWADDLIKDANHETVFFVCNRYNMIRKVEDQQRVKERCLSLLAPLTKQGAKHVFFINALGALDGRLQQDTEQLSRSKLPLVEEELHTFLANERGRVKLMRPAMGLQSAIREARNAIPQQQKLQQMDIDTLQTRYAQAQQGLDGLERERRAIIGNVKSFRGQVHNEIVSAATRFYTSIVNSVESWVSEYNVQQPMGLTEVFSGKARERVVTEVAEYLAARTATEFKEWQQTTLQPLITYNTDIIEQELGEKTQHFMTGLNEVRTELVANTAFDISSDAANPEQVSGKERALATVTGIGLGLVLGDPGLAIMGGMFGFKEMLKNILPQIAVMVATTIVLGPAFIIPAVLAASLARGIFKANSINKKIRDAVGKEYKQKVLEMHPDQIKELANSVDKKLAQLQDELDQAMGAELQNVRDQVQSIIDEKQQGEARVEQALHKLAQANDELNVIDDQLDALIGQIALS